MRRKTSLPAQNKFLSLQLRNENLLQRVKKWRPWDELWQDCQFLAYFFTFFSISEKVALAQVEYISATPQYLEDHFLIKTIIKLKQNLKLPMQVCRKWREVLYQPPFWRDVRPVLHCRDLRSWNSTEEWRENKRSFYLSIKLRGYDNICLLNANDGDVFDFIQNYPHGAKHIHTLR